MKKDTSVQAIRAAAAIVGNMLLTLLRNRRISFSQYGEDIAILRCLSARHAVPIYVDAGCFHPIWASNTLLLHKRGWRGINVDMSPDKIALFKQLRPLDVNVCAALSDKPRAMTQLTYECGGLTDRLGDSPFTKSLLDEEPTSAIQVNTTTLDWVIKHSGWKIDQIGYLNIDCEGHDLNVLKGFSLDKYRPSIITIEASLERAETVPYLAGFGYSHKETLCRTLLFVRQQ